jgi:hypothetical protein
MIKIYERTAQDNLKISKTQHKTQPKMKLKKSMKNLNKGKTGPLLENLRIGNWDHSNFLTRTG